MNSYYRIEWVQSSVFRYEGLIIRINYLNRKELPIYIRKTNSGLRGEKLQEQRVGIICYQILKGFFYKFEVRRSNCSP
jgi:hypothetical protein